MSQTRKNLVDIPYVAEYLGTNVRHVRGLIFRREIPFHKVGALVRFDLDDVDGWLEFHRISAAV